MGSSISESDTHILPPQPVKSEFENQSKSWKSTLVFTGNDLAFPVEMFIALMDQSCHEEGGGSPQETLIVGNALNHIPDIDENGDKRCPASVWKYNNISRLKKLNWRNLKEELMGEFSLKRDYGIHEKLELLSSIEKGGEESRDNFLLRISMIVCCIEHGNICDKTPSDVWVELLCTAGLMSVAHHNIPFLLKEKTVLEETSILSENVAKSQDTCKEYNNDVGNNILNPGDTDLGAFSNLQNCNVPLNDMKLENHSYQDYSDANTEMQMSIADEETVQLDPEFVIHGAEHQAKESRTRNKKYSCHVCGKMFKFKRNEMNHRFQEHNKDNQCYICNIPYKSLAERKEHRSRYHKNGKMCEICRAEFNSSKDVENHQIELHQGRQFKCNLCSSEMMYDAINQHFQNVHYDGRTKNIRVFKNKRRRFVSSLSKVPEGKDPRLQSTKSTDSPLKFVMPGGHTHLKGKVNTVVVFCGVCNKEMKNSKDLVEHRLQEHDGMKFRCDVCDYLCKRPAELARHRLSRHLLETEGFKSLTCRYDDCDFKCLEVSKDMLQKHIDGVHKKLKQNRCGVCDKMFSSKGTLKFHMGHVHMGLKKNMCDLCPKGYLNQRNLDHHKIIAHGIGELVKHVCYICGKEVTSKTNLTKHISWVHGIFKKKEYKKVSVECPHCNKSINKACLKLHIKRMHQEHKPFPCQQCGRGFASGGELNTHNKKVHLKVRPFRCRICGKTYPQGDDLKFHIGTLHEGMSMEEAKRQRFSLGPTHPAFERVNNKELDKMPDKNQTSAANENEQTTQNFNNEEENKPILE